MTNLLTVLVASQVYFQGPPGRTYSLEHDFVKISHGVSREKGLDFARRVATRYREDFPAPKGRADKLRIVILKAKAKEWTAVVVRLGAPWDPNILGAQEGYEEVRMVFDRSGTKFKVGVIAA